MPAKIIDGKRMALEILARLKRQIAPLSPKPCLAIVLVGDNPASVLYTQKKHEACKMVGMESRNIRLAASASQDEVVSAVRKLNADKGVHGILVQLPLPWHIDENAVLSEIAPEKDVDGFHPENMGRLALGLPCTAPCTPKGIVRMLKESGVRLEGKNAVVIGRSRIVGKPLALMLLNENCTVTVCHSKTRRLGEITKRADIVCVAVGKPNTLVGRMLKKGAVVVDAGTNRVGGRLVGDADFDSVAKKASLATPVPGGVGPMTIAMLIENALDCYRKITRRQ
ncbi:MAG: bifunctional 5,10-methylenetetrahydrofolate dehydrogenase/5,10-methenyltetrahydrofolate cyclohydrolase [Candidatus Micrarchaeota archaeon]|nr:bifunctional 5,10-methylenetetrahydrofolate dehydrogenase/5,10-methenyltetrahydrofolate cyclohydrolase [Candidatus Micrarchaeota archaeon]